MPSEKTKTINRWEVLKRLEESKEWFKENANGQYWLFVQVFFPHIKEWSKEQKDKWKNVLGGRNTNPEDPEVLEILEMLESTKRKLQNDE